MDTGHWIGTIGVTLLLMAFALNIAKKIEAASKFYLWLNLAGSILAGISSHLIAFWPFVILEGVWAVATLFALIKTLKK